MKKLLTTAFCMSILLMGAQAMASETSSNTTYAQKQTTATKVKPSDDFGRPPRFDKDRPPKPPMAKLEEELNLTDKQKEQAKANRIKARKEMKPIMEQIHAKKEAVLDVMDSDLSEEKQQEQIQKLQKEIKALYEKANTIREKNMKEFENILTTEQKAKFEKIKKEHHPHGQCKNCERRMPPPPMPKDDD